MFTMTGVIYVQCYYCHKYFSVKAKAMDHLNKVHADELERDGLDAAKACYLTTHDSLQGKCCCCPECQEVTEWSDRNGKPYRISNNPKCRARVAAVAKARLMNARGVDQHTLMSDMEHQREMLRQRRTSGVYRFQTDGGSVDYSSQLEKNFLEFCDRVLELPSNTIQDPPEAFEYFDPKENVKRFYAPDYYMPDYNLLIEIKDGGDKPNTNPKFLEETRYKVALKDAAMRKQDKYNFIRISGKQYGAFVETLFNIVHQQEDDRKRKKVMVVITESACADPEGSIEDIDQEEVIPDNIRLIVTRMPGTKIVNYAAITDLPHQSSWVMSDYANESISRVSCYSECFNDGEPRYYKYVGDPELIREAYEMIEDMQESTMPVITDILAILEVAGVYFDDGCGCSNNDERRSDFIEITRC